MLFILGLPLVSSHSSFGGTVRFSPESDDAVHWSTFSLPAAIATYGLSLGIANIDERLPAPVYALLTGLNAATVGIVALAAVQLSQKAITDKLTRILVFLGGTTGILYSALWYFPVLLVIAGASAIIWDYRWVHRLVSIVRQRGEPTAHDSGHDSGAVELTEASPGPAARRVRHAPTFPQEISAGDGTTLDVENEERTVPALREMRVFSWKFGVMVIAAFFVSFIIVMVLRGLGNINRRGFNLFANLYLAGTWNEALVIKARC